MSIKKVMSVILIALLIVPTLAYAEQVKVDTTQKGGVEPCLASCCIGPRVGLELNEGKEIRTAEWIGSLGQFVPYVGFLARPYMAYKMGYEPNGIKGCAASCCLGPRIGNELGERKIRTIEWLQLVPVINLYPAIAIPLEAYEGETMTEIAKKEHLRKK